MRIAIPISRFDKSGGIRVLCVLASGLAQRNHDVTFVVPRGQHQPTYPLDPQVHVRIVDPDMGNIHHISGLLKKVQLIYGLPETDVAIANAYMTAYSVWFGYKVGRVKYPIYYVQGYEPVAFGKLSPDSTAMKWLKTAAASHTYHLGLHCVVNSEWLGKLLASKHGIKSAIAQPGVDVRIFTPKAMTSLAPVIQVMTIGDKNPVKRMDLFARVMKELSARRSCTAIMASSDFRYRLQCEIPVNYYNPNNDYELTEVYHQADVFISTSSSEGFGLPLLEAMACGVPVVTTDSGGINDFCRDKYNCLIVSTDQATEIATVIDHLIADHELRGRLINNGLLTAREWGWKRLVDSFDHLLQELANKRSPYGYN